MNRRIEKVIANIISTWQGLFGHKVAVLPLKMVRLTEKFDVVVRPPFRGGFVIKSKD